MDVDCWLHVLRHLDSPADVQSVALTCRLFAEVCRSSTFFLSMFRRHFGRDFLRTEQCVSPPLLSSQSNATPDVVDHTDPVAYFRFLWQHRRHRTRLEGLYDAHYGLHGKEYVYVEQQG